eukprot:CAMPEP_0171031208 /NCGR_PEP_ID=MMETSP0736-20130129/37497_1 /TAXON_ID=186038 /ORGANISM="Fragilariopsis kerguelensis, Strain L26-C5" /LENGTH=183 /DNA_ID=CAMNT_0011473403 /DNA_START=17 /DNA_END=568 /DNA_ORIENTATION=+
MVVQLNFVSILHTPEGEALGVVVGRDVGDFVGFFVGDLDGVKEGALLRVGLALGAKEGKKLPDGEALGAAVGRRVGAFVGLGVGGFEGVAEGSHVGRFVGVLVGFFVGATAVDVLGDNFHGTVTSWELILWKSEWEKIIVKFIQGQVPFNDGVSTRANVTDLSLILYCLKTVMSIRLGTAISN